MISSLFRSDLLPFRRVVLVADGRSGEEASFGGSAVAEKRIGTGEEEDPFLQLAEEAVKRRREKVLLSPRKRGRGRGATMEETR
ncbi:D-alanine--D-alanine ligase [Sesbania bispinosa]|nr:D-alanine--D-alanine ligase [Sesbania bispinosa]